MLWSKDDAVNGFFNIKAKLYKNFKLLDYGLFLDKVNSSIDAKPDCMVSCSCCPRACLEVKCPYSVNFMSQEDANCSLPYLQNTDGKLTLKESDIIHNVKFIWELPVGNCATLTTKMFGAKVIG